MMRAQLLSFSGAIFIARKAADNGEEVRVRPAGVLVAAVAAPGAVAAGPAPGAVLSGTAVAAGAGNRPERPWEITPIPDGAGPVSYLISVSCAAPQDCASVGTTGDSSGTAGRTLAESWNGSRWRRVPSPNGGLPANLLNGVSCPAARYCIAVGSSSSAAASHTLAEAWDGTRWRVLPSPDRARTNVLAGVSCRSRRACVAVGYSGAGKPTAPNLSTRTLIESWNGHVWQIMASPNVPRQPVNLLISVACRAAGTCLTVGAAGNRSSTRARSLAESWNGRRWAITPSPDGPLAVNEFTSVSCLPNGRCLAVGISFNAADTHGDTLAAAWTHGRWSQLAAPRRKAAFNLFYATDCVTATDCTVAGVTGNTHGDRTRTLIENFHWPGWTIAASPNVPSAALNDLYGLACPSQATCLAVGFSGNSHYTRARPLAERRT